MAFKTIDNSANSPFSKWSNSPTLNVILKLLNLKDGTPETSQLLWVKLG